MSDIDISLHRTIGRDWIKSCALFAICACCTALMVYATTTTGTSAHDIRFRSGAYFILPFMAPFTVWVLYRLVVPFGALLSVSPDGFADRRVNSDIVPWSGIGNITRRGEFISITLKRGVLKTYTFSTSQRLIKSRRKTARPSHLLVATWGVAPANLDLVTLLKSYHGAYAQNPARA